jgi:hypothetical protein
MAHDYLEVYSRLIGKATSSRCISPHATSDEVMTAWPTLSHVS